MSRLATAVVGDAGELDSLAGDWWQLWRATLPATPFQSPAWLLAWWRAFAPGELAMIAVREQHRLVALAPLYVERGEHGVRLLPIGISASDYLDVLIAPGYEAEAGEAIVGAATSIADWWAWELSDLAPEALARNLPCPCDGADGVRAAAACPVIDLPPLQRCISAIVPAPQRRKLRMAHHRLDRRGPWRIHATGDLTAGRWIEMLAELHALRWRSRGEAGVLGDRRMLELLATAMPRLAEAGLLRCYALETAGAIVGAFTGFAHRGRVYAWLGGLDPAFAALSPGTVLIGHALGEAIREGAHAFDFLRGSEDYKYRWGARDRRTATRTITRRRDA